MPDDNLYGPDEDPRIGGGTSRRRLLRDILFFIRTEGDKMRVEFTTGLAEFERRIMESRPGDIEAGLRRCLEIKPEEMAELRDLVHDGLQSRRARQERWREIWALSKSVAAEIVKHALTSAFLAGAAYYGYSTWFK